MIMKEKLCYKLFPIGAISFVLLVFIMCVTPTNKDKESDSTGIDTIAYSGEDNSMSSLDSIKMMMSDEFCRTLIAKVVKERFNIEPEAIVIEWKDVNENESYVAGSFFTDWLYKKDKNTKHFDVKIKISGKSYNQPELVDAEVSSVNTDGYSSLTKIFEIRDGQEVKIYLKPGSEITIGGIKVQMAAQHYPIQEFITSQKLSRSQMQQVWECEDRDPACKTLQFRLPNRDRHDWYAELEEKSLYIMGATANQDQWYEITKNGKNWSYKKVRL